MNKPDKLYLTCIGNCRECKGNICWTDMRISGQEEKELLASFNWGDVIRFREDASFSLNAADRKNKINEVIF